MFIILINTYKFKHFPVYQANKVKLTDSNGYWPEPKPLNAEVGSRLYCIVIEFRSNVFFFRAFVYISVWKRSEIWYQERMRGPCTLRRRSDSRPRTTHGRDTRLPDSDATLIP